MKKYFLAKYDGVECLCEYKHCETLSPMIMMISDADYEISDLRFIKWSSNMKISEDLKKWKFDTNNFVESMKVSGDDLYKFENDEAAILAYEVL